MKVLGLVASPRKLGNSEILVKEMLSSLPENIEKEMIRLADLDVKPCKACYACLPAEKDCVLKDDLAFLLDKIKEADAVIIASACYFLGSHTSIKNIGDRLISVLANSTAFAGKKCVTAIVYGIPGWDGYAREAVNNFARFLHLELVGDMLVQGASPGEVVRPDVIAEARALAASLLNSATESIVKQKQVVLKCQGCGSSLLQIMPSGHVRCVMCGSEGELEAGSQDYKIKFAANKHIRFSVEGMSEHSRKLENVKQNYIANRNELYKRRKDYDTLDWWVSPSKK